MKKRFKNIGKTLLALYIIIALGIFPYSMYVIITQQNTIEELQAETPEEIRDRETAEWYQDYNRRQLVVANERAQKQIGEIQAAMDAGEVVLTEEDSLLLTQITELALTSLK